MNKSIFVFIAGLSFGIFISGLTVELFVTNIIAVCEQELPQNQKCIITAISEEK